jgi:uncharacterized protein
MSAAILERWYAALKAGDADALAAVTTEDVRVVWNGPPGLVPWAGEWRGRAEVTRFFHMVGEHLEILSVTAEWRIEGADGVAIVLAGHWRVRATGAELRLRAVNLFTFDGDRVAAYEVFPDSHAFVAALGMR